MTLSLVERSEVELDLIRLWADLGRILATSAINELAAKRREEAITAARGEIARLTRLLYTNEETA